MKKLIVLSFLLFSFPAFAGLLMPECESCACKTTSHTTFVIRPPYTWTSPEVVAHFHQLMQQTENPHSGVIQVVPFGGSSLKNERIAKYFLPTCSDTIETTEQQECDCTNVLARQLNIYTEDGEFKSCTQFKPTHHYFGVGLTYQQIIHKRPSGTFFWWAVSAPVMQVRNKIELCEQVENNGGGPLRPDQRGIWWDTTPCISCDPDESKNSLPVANVTQAFAQSGWCFGRIDGETHSKTAISDLAFIVGFASVDRPELHMSSYIGGIFPTGNRGNAVNVFEPIVGNGKHYGFLIGTTFDFHVWYSEKYDFEARSAFDFDITYFAPSKEFRSFDLKHKPWSRYMQFYGSKEQAQQAFDAQGVDPFLALTLHTPGINLLTQEVKVKPGFFRSFTIGLTLARCYAEIEVGYNFFARQAECVEFPECFPCDAALKSLDGSGKTDPVQMINTTFPANCSPSPFADYDQNIVRPSDLDIESAAAPAVLSHTVFGSIAYRTSIKCFPTLFAVGGSFEFSPNNNGMDRWMAWIKGDLSF